MATNTMKLGLVLSATDKMSRIIDQATKKSSDKLKKFENTVKSLNKTSNIIGAAGVAVVGALVADFNSIAAKAKQITFSAQKTGLNAEQFQIMSGYAKKMGLEVEGFEMSIGKLQKTQVEAAKGSKSAMEKFKMAGIAIYDAKGNLKSADVVIGELSNKFKKMPDGPKKTALSMMLFGKSGKAMIPMLNSGSKAMDEYGKMMRENGNIIDNKALKQFGAYRGAIGKAKLAMEGAKQTIAIELLPTAIKLLDKIGAITKSVAKFIKEHKSAISTVAKFGFVLIGISATLRVITTIMKIQKGVMIGWNIVQGISAFVTGKNTMALRANTFGLKAYLVMMKAATIGTNILKMAQLFLNAAFIASPIGWIVLGIGALIAIIVVCWKKFAGFRAFIKTMWDTIKGFGNILKEYIVDRIKGIISGLGSMGRSIALLFKGKFKEAGAEAAKGIKQLAGHDATIKAMSKTKKLATTVSSTYAQKLKVENEAQKPQSKSAGVTATKVANTTAVEHKKTNVVYSPTINIGGGTPKDKQDFANMLKSHKKELQSIFIEISNNNKRLSYS